MNTLNETKETATSMAAVSSNNKTSSFSNADREEAKTTGKESMTKEAIGKEPMTKEQVLAVIAALPPKVIGDIKSTHFYETVKKLGEPNAIAVIVLYTAIQNRNGEPQLSRIGKAIINAYLNEGATRSNVKSPMALSSYRVRRVKPFFDKKGLSASDRAEMQDILYALACDEQSCEDGFKALP